MDKDILGDLKMNDRTKSVLEQMRQNTQYLVDDVREKIAMAQTTQTKTSQVYQIISFPIRMPMNAGVNRHSRRQHKLQEMMLT